jgi:hypothetical protein
MHLPFTIRHAGDLLLGGADMASSGEVDFRFTAENASSQQIESMFRF